jgi:hypothetical protein
MADAALKALSPTFEKMYSKMGRPSIPPEQLLKASLLMAFYTVRSERLGIQESSFDHSTFSQNRERLLEHDVARQFFFAVMGQAQSAGVTSNEHFTVDGSLIDAWASVKSFRPKDEKEGDRPPPDDRGNPTTNFHGETRSNPTHESKTDPEPKLARKGHNKEARLSYGQQRSAAHQIVLVRRAHWGTFNPQLKHSQNRPWLSDHRPGNAKSRPAADRTFSARFAALWRRAVPRDPFHEPRVSGAWPRGQIVNPTGQRDQDRRGASEVSRIPA